MASSSAMPPLMTMVSCGKSAFSRHARSCRKGGIADDDAIALHLQHVDGVMVGRHAYHEPFAMAGWDARFFGAQKAVPMREAVEEGYVQYMEQLAAQGVPWSHASRHLLGLRNGLPGARRWRQVWSDHRLKAESPRRVGALASASTQASTQADTQAAVLA